MSDPSQREINDGWKYGPQIVILVMALCALAGAGILLIDSFFSPAAESIRRETYEESKSYQDGTVRNLDDLRLQWITAEGAHKDAIAEIARHRAADFPRDQLPPRIVEWLEGIEGGR